VEFYQRSSPKPRSLAVLAGSFNPPTVAHVELAQAATLHAEEILCVVPSALPHKGYFGATLAERLEMLASVDIQVQYSIAATEGGLFLDIARECREHYGADTRLFFACGRDAAERILTWDYGRPGVVEEMLRDFELLVARRGGAFSPPPSFRRRIHELATSGEHDAVSSSEVRQRIARGQPWEHLVPATIARRVREIYS